MSVIEFTTAVSGKGGETGGDSVGTLKRRALISGILIILVEDLETILDVGDAILN